MPETMKGKLVAEYTKRAAEAYDRIVTRYPAMERAKDARERLTALKQPVPTPTAEAIKQSKAEEASRGEQGHIERLMGVIRHAPDTSHAAKIGEPQMEEEKQSSATDLVQQTRQVLANKNAAPAGTTTELGLEAGTAGTGKPPESEAPPTSGDAQPKLENATPQAAPPAVENPAPMPPQTNEAAAPAEGQSSTAQTGTPPAAADKKAESTSKKKKKSGLRKLIPF
jgi:hypothetical protein